MAVHIFIQARMSSSRYPGKVLAPVFGKPLIAQVIERMQNVGSAKNVVVLTSTEISDDPLEAYVNSLGVNVFRGSLDNVYGRFQEALKKFPCEYFVRICADSPFIAPRLVDFMVRAGMTDRYDLISNVAARKFPKGQSVEILRSALFESIQPEMLNAQDREHVTPYFYKNSQDLKCLFYELAEDKSHINQCIDTIEDLKEIERRRDLYDFKEENICICRS